MAGRGYVDCQSVDVRALYHSEKLPDAVRGQLGNQVVVGGVRLQEQWDLVDRAAGQDDWQQPGQLPL